ncbi:MAG: T9SS type A sorting domain-containing protein, partial [Bacteroidales bacterium]|nr:T9SS type A sorting domain-containing protein [Bacteroidales bacterium]
GTYTIKFKLEKRVGGVAGTPWLSIYNPQFVGRQYGPLLGGYDNVPDTQELIAARNLTVVINPTLEPAAAPHIPTAIGDYTETPATAETYPNPANNTLNLVLTGMDGVISITITDATGRVIETIEANILDNETIITNDVSKYAQGIYFVNIKNNDTNLTKKFIVNHK